MTTDMTTDMTTGLPWLAAPMQRFEARLARGQLPQAMLIHGPAGCGRRHLALALAARFLESDWQPAADADADDLPGVPHPDFWSVGSEGEGRPEIKVDQIRELNHALVLTSHRQGRKAAVIYPADAMNLSAANAFLKTLEEPPAGTLLILVGTAAGRLPATVVSRCERLRISPPAPELALGWLASHGADRAACERALAFAAGAPLLARNLLAGTGGQAAAGTAPGGTTAAGTLAQTLADLGAEIQQLIDRVATPVTLGRTWARRDHGVCLRWLYLQTAQLIREAARRSGQGPGASAPAQDRARPFPLNIPHAAVNMAACCVYLDQVLEAERLKDRSVNMEAVFAELLLWWYGAVGATR